MSRSSLCHPCGRAEPAPPRGASLGERPCGENPGMALKGVFLEQLSPSLFRQLPHYAPCPESTVDIGAGTLASLGKLWIVAAQVTVSNLKFLAHGHGFLIRMSPALHGLPSRGNPSPLSKLSPGGPSGQWPSSLFGDTYARKYQC